jgi:uncharacterized membrane protein YuzA (DUF378 family)
MTRPTHTASNRFLLSGAAAGAGSAFAFTALHHLVISDIWFSLPLMLGAGALSGVCLAWTYGLLFDAPTARGWWLYNGVWVALLVLLGAASFVVYQPVTTMAAVMASGGAPPPELLQQAMPLTVGFILATTAVLSLVWGRSAAKAASIFVTTTVIIVLLGINVSALGLVELDGSAAVLLAEMLVLVMALLFGFAGIFQVLERRRFRATTTLPSGRPAVGVMTEPR